MGPLVQAGPARLEMTWDAQAPSYDTAFQSADAVRAAFMETAVAHCLAPPARGVQSRLSVIAKRATHKPRGRSPSTAWISEEEQGEGDDPEGVSTGRFTANIDHGDRLERGPVDVPLAEALRWARLRARKVIVTSGEKR